MMAPSPRPRRTRPAGPWSGGRPGWTRSRGRGAQNPRSGPSFSGRFWGA